MYKSRCCGTGTKSLNDAAYEVVRLQKTTNVCPMCEDYAKRQETKPIAVICCEGAACEEKWRDRRQTYSATRSHPIKRYASAWEEPLPKTPVRETS